MVNLGSKPPSVKRLQSYIGRILAAHSLLTLITDFTPVALYGHLEKWFDSYADIVEKVNQFLFGWIASKWFSVTSLEFHSLVVVSIFAGSTLRTLLYHITKEIEKHERQLLKEIKLQVFLFSIVLSIPSIFLILLPEDWSISVSMIIVILLAMMGSHNYDSFKYFIRELGNIVLMILIILIINYWFMKPG